MPPLRLVRVVAPTALLAVELLGCRCDPTSAEKSPHACSAPVKATDEVLHPILAPRDVTLELLRPGSSPRRKLRYGFEPGQKFAFEVLPIQGEDDQGEASGMTIYVEGIVGCVDPDGNARIDYQLGLRGRIHEGARAYALMDERGSLREGGLLATVPVDPKGVTHPREGLPIPLPEPKVGLGAIWVVSRTLESGVRQRTSFEVVALDEDLVQTRVLIDTKTPSGESAAPPGAGNTTIDLRGVVATGWFLFDAPDGQRAGLRIAAR